VNPQLAARVGPDAAELMARYRGLIWGSRIASFGGVFAIFLVFAVIPPITKFMLIAFLAYFPVAIAMLIVCLIKGRAAARRAEVVAGAFVSKAGEITVARVPRVLMREPLTALDAWLLDKHAWPTEPPAGSSMVGVEARPGSTPYPTNFTGLIVGCSIMALGVVVALAVAVIGIVGAASGQPVLILPPLMGIAAACIALGAIVAYGSNARQARARIAWNSVKRD
jgi:hypothetical protein